MGININSNAINDGAQTLKNLSQVAANLTKPQPKPQEKPKQENFNQPHTQTMELKIGDMAPQPKPLVLKEKSETHVHKYFPENRELSERECQVRELELKNEHEYKMRQLDDTIRAGEEYRKDRKEKEELERKEREEARRRGRRNAAIFMGALGVAAVGGVAYYLYTSSRNPANQRVAIPSAETVTMVPGEGTVK